MSGRIPQAFIDDLLARTDIVDLIDGYVPLKKAGQNHQARCPFHDEKTPSFTVNQDKQFYHCFGCGANGNAISFLMEYNRMEFVEAIEALAERAGMTIPREAGSRQQGGALTELYELMELVVEFYRRQLREHPQAGKAREYLQRRGIADDLVQGFELGYAPAGWDNLINALGKSGAARERLGKAGLTIRKDGGGVYDRFRDRVIYPIRDQRGRAIGIGGRVIDDGTPKYLNSPETPIFHKGRELYGLYQARRAHRELSRLFVVEGYMDVLALAGQGLTNTVATLGTAVTADHLERLFRSVHEVVFCFDGDEAGAKAAWRALETSLPLLRDGRQVYFRFLDQGFDPDDFIRARGRGEFEDSARFLPLSDFLLRELTRDFNPAILEHRGDLLFRATPYLNRMPHSNLKSMLTEKLASLAETDAGRIEGLLELPAETRPRRIPRGDSGGGERNLVTQAIRLLLQRPALALGVSDITDLEYLDSPATRFLVELIELVRHEPGITCARIIEHWRGTKFEQRLSQLAPAGQSRYAADEAALSSGEYLESEFLGAITQIREGARRKRLAESSRRQSPGRLSEEQKEEIRRNLKPAPGKVREN